MEYRQIGKTGIQASVIGLGSEGIARISAADPCEMIHDDCVEVLK
jgi:aryl-alcohol dehydrogenase-like predicted oxidoreductase